jgi:hypothetical protein
VGCSEGRHHGEGPAFVKERHILGRTPGYMDALIKECADALHHKRSSRGFLTDLSPPSLSHRSSLSVLFLSAIDSTLRHGT